MTATSPGHVWRASRIADLARLATHRRPGRLVGALPARSNRYVRPAIPKLQGDFNRDDRW